MSIRKILGTVSSLASCNFGYLNCLSVPSTGSSTPVFQTNGDTYNGIYFNSFDSTGGIGSAILGMAYSGSGATNPGSSLIQF